MKIGIIGSGNMGRTLGIAWAEQGHDVFFGGRHPEQAKRAADLAQAASGKPAAFGTNTEAAAFGEVVFYSPRDIAPQDVIDDASLLDGKVVIDPANEMPPRPDWLNYQNIETVSLAERLQAHIPNARVVKAFNTVSQENITQDVDLIREEGLSVLIAGDDTAARDTVARLSEELGFTAVDSGPLSASRHIEAAARYLIYLMGERGLGTGASINIRVLPPSPNGEKYGENAPDRSYN